MQQLSPTFSNTEVGDVVASYPDNIRKKILFLRQLIFATAAQTPGVGQLDETLKWGEPSYITTQSKSASTVRIAWKKSDPHSYAIYFNCKTRLVETFKELYGDIFKFSGNRAIIFSETDTVPVAQLQHCIALSLTYHQIKHLPMLGV
jgi:hypothetical protein